MDLVRRFVNTGLVGGFDTVIHIGIDTGGTFTDFVSLDDETGEVRIAKLPSNQEHPDQVIKDGLRELIRRELPYEITIATTIVTNSVLEGRGPRVILLINTGFEDVIHIGRLDKEKLYDVNWRKPAPLVRRNDCIGINCRLDRSGDEIVPLEKESFECIEKSLNVYASSENIAVAICFLFSYVNNVHEWAVGKKVQEILPRSKVSLSSDVAPVWREFERANTTIIDAFSKPIVSEFVKLVGGVIDKGKSSDRWNLLASNGGFVRATEIVRRPVDLLFSGLAGGLVGAQAVAEQLDVDHVISLDMGGTSTDIGIISEGALGYRGESSVEWGLPVVTPSVDVRTIGAGGGSIAWIDKGSMLHVGPESAGANPGPAAYGLGGVKPTVTDANLVLGRLEPEYFLGGTLELDAAAARRVVSAIGDRLDRACEEAALDIIGMANENMANAIRLLAVDKGIDVREFSLMCFGGAGPLHACSIADLLGMTEVIIPTNPGVHSALGVASAEARIDRVKTIYARFGRDEIDLITSAEQELRLAAIDELRRTVACTIPDTQSFFLARHIGENHTLDVAFSPTEMGNGKSAEKTMLAAFHHRHAEAYGFSLEDQPVEVVGVRVKIRRIASSIPELRYATGWNVREAEGSGRVWYEGFGPLETRILHRATLKGGQVDGPAIIVQGDSTILLRPNDSANVVAGGALCIRVNA